MICLEAPAHVYLMTSRESNKICINGWSEHVTVYVHAKLR